MAKICVNEKTAQRQQAIQDALLGLMLKKKYEEITVTDLCESMGMVRRSFYRYFDNLDDVLESAMNQFFQRMVIPGGVPKVEAFRENYEFWLEHRGMLDALHRSNMLDKLYEYTFRFTNTEDIRNHLPEEDRELWREASQFVISGSVSLVIFWYENGFQKTPEEMARIAYRMLFQPLLGKTDERL